MLNEVPKNTSCFYELQYCKHKKGAPEREIVSVEKDSLGYKIFLNHGGNLFSRVSGISLISPGIQAGAKIQADDVLGRLSPSDSSAFFLEVLRNGRFVRWDDFYRETHVAEANYVTRFRMDAGF